MHQKSEPRVVSIASGKGGVGKTLTTINLAITARKANLRVLIFDGDLGLSNVDVVLGLQARYNINDVLDGNVSLRDVVIQGPMGIDIISSGSGISRLQSLSYVQRQMIADELMSLEEEYDLILIDTGAGISDSVIHLNLMADRQIVVTTPEPHAMTDAYALVKVLSEKSGNLVPGLLVNMVRTNEEGESIANRLNDVAVRFIQTPIEYLGCVPLDTQIGRAVLLRNAASEQTMATIAGQAWNRIGRQVFVDEPAKRRESGGPSFWQNLLWTQASPASCG